MLLFGEIVFVAGFLVDLFEIEVINQVQKRKVGLESNNRSN
jgi:hypothetical protein